MKIVKESLEHMGGGCWVTFVYVEDNETPELKMIGINEESIFGYGETWEDVGEDGNPEVLWELYVPIYADQYRELQIYTDVDIARRVHDIHLKHFNRELWP